MIQSLLEANVVVREFSCTDVFFGIQWKHGCSNEKAMRYAAYGGKIARRGE